MDSLFVRQAPKKGRFCLMLGASLLLHGGLIGIAALWTAPEPPPHSVVIDITDTEPPTQSPPGNPPVVESTPAETPETTATPDVLVKAEPTPPEPESTPDFAQAPEQTPPRRVSPSRLVTATSTNHPPMISRSLPGPSNGGTPGGPAGGSANTAGVWAMPHPPYPHTVLAQHRSGATTVRITTDASGRVSNAIIVKSTGNPALDSQTESYVRMNWHGPPNASRTTEFVYQIK